VAGRSEGGRFSARLSEVRTETFPAFERIVLDFELEPESAPLSAAANCLSARDFVETTRAAAAPGAFVLQVNFPAWLQDDAARSSVLTSTLALTDTTVATTLDLQFVPDSDAGATLTVALKEARPFRLSLDPDQPRILIEVARSTPLTDESDPLRITLGSTLPRLPAPLYFLLNGDIWRLDDTGAISLTDTLEAETSLAVSPDGTQLAFCRNQDPGGDLAEQERLVPSKLWLMNSDGSNPRLLADVGINCADPVFSPDGEQVAFSVDEFGVLPAQRSIWTVQLNPPTPTPVVADAGIGGNPTPAPEAPPAPEGEAPPEPEAEGQAEPDAETAPTSTSEPAFNPFQRVAGDSEWSRAAPQWLDNETLIYVANAPDGRSTLLVRAITNNADPSERDVGAEVLANNRYTAFGAPQVAPDGRTIAVEATRLDRTGTELVLLDASGNEQDVIGGDFWTRFAGWGFDGSFAYLTATCESTFAHEYSLHQRQANGTDRVLAAGITLGAIGDTAVFREGVAYSTSDLAQAGARGPANVAAQGQTSVWFWHVDDEQRGALFTAGRRVSGLTR